MLHQANLEVQPAALEAIAVLALEKKTGARGLRAIMVCHCLLLLSNSLSLLSV